MREKAISGMQDEAYWRDTSVREEKSVSDSHVAVQTEQELSDSAVQTTTKQEMVPLPVSDF